jgi:hypothetical protein
MKITRKQLRRLIKEASTSQTPTDTAVRSLPDLDMQDIRGLLVYLLNFKEQANLDQSDVKLIDEFIDKAEAHIGWEK